MKSNLQLFGNPPSWKNSSFMLDYINDMDILFSEPVAFAKIFSLFKDPMYVYQYTSNVSCMEQMQRCYNI